MHQTTCIWRHLSVGSMFLSLFFTCIPGLLRYCDRYYLGMLGAHQLTQTSSNFSGFPIAPMGGNLIVNANHLRQAAGVGGADNQAESQLIHPWINHTSWGLGKAVASADKQTW